MSAATAVSLAAGLPDGRHGAAERAFQPVIAFVQRAGRAHDPGAFLRQKLGDGLADAASSHR